jgi:GT2 family glycosyltransferase
MKVSIVIPNYNGQASLSKNISQVLKTGADEIVVVDDGSDDRSVEYLKKNFPQLKIIQNQKNMGFSSTVNRGVEEALGEVVVLLNTDVMPQPSFLKPLIGHFNDPDLFAAGCLDRSVEDGTVILRGRGLARWSRGFLNHKRGEVDKTDTFWVAGGSGAFRKKIWQSLEGLDSLFNPFYWEDIDLSYRAQKAGYKILFEPVSQVNHLHEQGAIRKKFSPFFIKTISYRNQFFFVWKNISDKNLIISHLLWLPYHFLTALLRLDFAFFLGFLMATVKLPLVLSSRQKVLTSFKMTDEEILGKTS